MNTKAQVESKMTGNLYELMSRDPKFPTVYLALNVRTREMWRVPEENLRPVEWIRRPS